MSHGIFHNGIYYKRELEKDRLRIGGGSWSINLEEVEGKYVKEFVFITEKARYSVTPKVATDHGFERVLGGERKWVVPIKHWKVETK